MKILHIDDNHDITNMFSELIMSLGFDYVFTNEPKEGIKYIRNEQYDVILLDLHMPEMSGMDIIDLLEREKILKDQKIVMLSGYPFNYNQRENLLQKPGIHCCLKKPIEFTELIDIITA